MALTKLTTDLIDGSLGTNWQTTAKTAPFTAVAGEGYYVDTSSSAITVTLPASPSDNDEIIIVDYASNAGTNNITLGRNSLKIRGGTDDLVLDVDNQTARLVYSGATKGWLVTSEASTIAVVVPDLTVDYLVVAGGGGGGGRQDTGSGGGGAGGLLASYGVAGTNALDLAISTNYSVTIGSGGTAGYSNSGAGRLGGNGANSIFSTITSTGGGGGGAWQSPAGGLSGGSGGGGAYNGSGGTGTSGQGNNGGAGSIGTNQGAGGGGGAGAAGSNGSANAGGNGGVGATTSILSTSNATTSSVGEVSGASLYFSGGGGGGLYPNSSTTVGTGGLGGGGNAIVNADGENATANTGGGGGGSGDNPGESGYGGVGGSGVVILRYPDAYTITVGSGITQASGSPFTESSDKVSVFTAGTGTITFST